MHPVPGLRHTYALSRFPTRHTGASRARERPQPSEKNQPFTLERPQPWHAIPPVNRTAQSLYTLLMQNDTLLVERQIEMLNIFVGFEQSNKYSISNNAGVPLGYIAEEPKGFLGTLARQAFATHRPFRAVIMDLKGSPILWVRRPFSWINSRMYVQRQKEDSKYSPDELPVLDTFGEVQQVWHPWRRRYGLFLSEAKKHFLSTTIEPQPEPEPSTFSQFGQVDMGFLSWHFRLYDSRGEEIAYISRAFRGFGREIFTDTGQYCITFGPGPVDPRSTIETPHQLRHKLTLDERALVLALAVNIDFDYFSRHSGPGSGGLFAMSSFD